MSQEALLLDSNLVWWLCPVCDWAISGIEKQYARFDYECPGCGVRNFSDFEPVAVKNT
jgi:predicted RNA-binding Zn-ribbon protein involved in translation (DUF1610 family)